MIGILIIQMNHIDLILKCIASNVLFLTITYYKYKNIKILKVKHVGQIKTTQCIKNCLFSNSS